MKNIRLFETVAEFEAVKASLATPNISLAGGKVFYLPAPEGPTYEFVDLGLQSGTLWATCNLGASSPEEYGNYYIWGDVEPCAEGNVIKKSADWVNTPWGQGTPTMDVLDAEHDAAYQATNGAMRMPTKEEFEELVAGTTPEYEVFVNEVKCMKLTSKVNGNSIFIPYSGNQYRESVDETDYSFNLWSSTRDIEYSYSASDLYGYIPQDPTYSRRLVASYGARRFGFGIRGVKNS